MVKTEKKPPFERKPRPEGQKDFNRPFNKPNASQQKETKAPTKTFLPKITDAPPIQNKERNRMPEKKKEYKGDDKKTMNKRTLIRKGFM